MNPSRKCCTNVQGFCSPLPFLVVTTAYIPVPEIWCQSHNGSLFRIGKADSDQCRCELGSDDGHPRGGGIPRTAPARGGGGVERAQGGRKKRKRRDEQGEAEGMGLKLSIVTFTNFLPFLMLIKATSYDYIGRLGAFHIRGLP